MSQAKIGSLHVSLGMDTAQFQAGAKRAQSTLGGLTSSLKSFAGGAIAGLSLHQVSSAAIIAVQRVAELGDVAENIGITAEQMQNYNRMALASGASSEAMARGLQSIAEQSTDTESKLSKLFEANGITAKGMAVNDVIRTFMTLLNNARNPAEQLAAATTVLGDRVGRELVESMRVGAAGVDASFDEMVASGEFHTNSEVARLQEIETEYNKVTARIATLWQQMVLQMIDHTVTLVNSTQSGLEQSATAFERWKSGLNIFEGMPNDTVELWKKMLGGEPVEFVVPQVSAPGKGDLFQKPSGKPTELPDPQAEKAAQDAAKRAAAEAKKQADEAARALEHLRDAGMSVWEQTRTPIENYQIEIRRLNDLLSQGVIDNDTYARAVKGLQDTFGETAPVANEFAEAMEGVAGSAIDSFTESLNGLASGTMTVSDAFENMKSNLLSDLSDLASQFLKTGLMNLLFGGGAGVAPSQQGGGLLGGLFGGFGGARAGGGPVSFGKSYLVGENGPELFSPGSSGNITPNDMMGGGGGATVNVYNQAGDATVEQRQRQNADGSMTVDVWFKKKLQQHSPDVNRKAIPGAFGVNPSLINR